MGDLIKLRELPGVDSIADLCRNSRNFEYPTSSYTQDKIDDVSIRLFGITQHDTKWNVEAYLAQLNDEYDDGDDDDDVDLDDDSYEDEIIDTAAEAEAWEEKFHATRLPWPQNEPFWRAIGWDISDGAGHELICAHCFDRQIIAATGDLVEGACVNLDARGALTRAPVDEGALEDSLKREADAFIAKHRRR